MMIERTTFGAITVDGKTVLLVIARSCYAAGLIKPLQFPPESGKRRPCRDVAMPRSSLALRCPKKAKRASHIGPPSH